MPEPIRLRVFGDYALFSRPELKVERYSYDVMTPSAARGILDAIYYHPGLRWCVKRIIVERPIRFTNIRRNEVSKKILASDLFAAANGSEKPVFIDRRDAIAQRAATVLRDVSFTAKQGQVTALVGPSGGGKSTVAKLAAKFYPLDGGRILLGGTDIAPLNSTMLMKNFSIVFQDVVLFNNTIMENIRVGKKDATDEEVIAAAKAAQCDEFISKLPDGYQTVIGENGSTLSGGECQRLSIARALLKDAPVILLDEATASLDVDNETEIQNAISRLVKGKTVLIIAHRMRTVEAADNIVVLSDGMVVENGTHEKLMKENGLYRKLVDLQTASANWRLSV